MLPLCVNLSCKIPRPFIVAETDKAMSNHIDSFLNSHFLQNMLVVEPRGLAYH